MRFRRAVVILAVFLVLPCAAVSSLSFSIDELDANASLLFLFSNPPTAAVAYPNLGIPPLIGVSIPFRQGGPYFLAAGVEFLGWYYEVPSNTSTVVIQRLTSRAFIIGG